MFFPQMILNDLLTATLKNYDYPVMPPEITTKLMRK